MAVGALTILLSGDAFSDASEEWLDFLTTLGVERDEILCEGKKNGDHFLIAWKKGGLLAVDRVEITGKNGRITPFIISWSFTDENGSSIDANLPPKSVIKQITKSKNRVYVESASYRSLLLKNVIKVGVSIAIDKSDTETNLTSGESPDFDQIASTFLCELPVKDLR